MITMGMHILPRLPAKTKKGKKERKKERKPQANKSTDKSINPRNGFGPPTGNLDPTLFIRVLGPRVYDKFLKV